jgi:hypothetical protein
MLNDIQITSDYMSRWVVDWVRTIRSLVQGRIHKLKNCVNSRPKSVFKDQEAVKCLSSLHDKYVIIPADKAYNNINYFVEQVDDPAMYLSLYGVLWSLGIQYK